MLSHLIVVLVTIFIIVNFLLVHSNLIDIVKRGYLLILNYTIITNVMTIFIVNIMLYNWMISWE